MPSRQQYQGVPDREKGWGGWERGREARACFDTTMYMITWHRSAKRRKQNSVVISLYERLILKSGPADHKSDRSTFKELPYLVMTSFIYTAFALMYQLEGEFYADGKLFESNDYTT